MYMSVCQVLSVSLSVGNCVYYMGYGTLFWRLKSPKTIKRTVANIRRNVCILQNTIKHNESFRIEMQAINADLVLIKRKWGLIRLIVPCLRIKGWRSTWGALSQGNIYFFI